MSIYGWPILELELLSEVSARLNEAASKHDEHDRVSLKCKALNRLFNHLHRVSREQGPTRRSFGTTDDSLFDDMVRSSISFEERRRLCNNGVVAMLLSVKPLILNEDELSRPYLPPDSQPPDERRRAEREHRKANEAFDHYQKGLARGVSRDAPIRQLVKLLWMIRSNVQHGAKTSRSPNQDKVSRDREISSRWLGVVDLLFEMLLDYPNRRLTLYGPEDRNQSVIVGITGEWSTKCSVEGVVAEKDGRQAFLWTRDGGESVDVDVLESAELASSWLRLDESYGPGYLRILVPVEIGGKPRICWIYESRPMQGELGATH